MSNRALELFDDPLEIEVELEENKEEEEEEDDDKEDGDDGGEEEDEDDDDNGDEVEIDAEFIEERMTNEETD